MSNRKSDTKDSASYKTDNLGRELHPQLLWPNFRRLGDGFDEDDELIFKKTSKKLKKQRADFYEIQKNQGLSVGSNSFWDAFCYSKDVVLVDKFFNKNAYMRMIFELKRIFISRDKFKKRIQIYCSDTYSEIEKIDRQNRKKYPDVMDYFVVSVNLLTLQNTTHDRFAIMDGEIWHCGAAVGGMHAELSALSRGWKDENDNLKKYFCGEEEEYDT